MLSLLKTAFKIILAWGSVWLPAPGWADSDLPLLQRKQEIQSRITRQEEQIRQLTWKEKQVIQDLNDIDYALNQARIRATSLRGEARKLAENMAAVRAEQQVLDRRIQENREYAGDRLAALYRMRMIGRLDVMGPPDALFDFFVTQQALKRIVRSDYQALDRQVRDLELLKNLAAQLVGQKAGQDLLEQALARQARIMEQKSEEKQAVRREIRQKKALTLAALASLEEAVKSLDEQVRALEKQAGVWEGATGFSHLKGRLSLPVNGQIVSRFGPRQPRDYKSFIFQSGIDIKVERGEPVRAVFKGEVMFAEWLKGYGNLLIINHGEHYYTLYAHLQEMFKMKGDRVGTGEVIATVGDTGSIKGLCLHFELRHHGRPVDPLKWLDKGA